jgi:WD40 repeat protein
MGVVYKARQVALNRIVAIKMILAGQFASKADVRRFHIEAEAAANLKHPNIVAIYEVGECDGEHFFSMEYVEGTSLSSLVGDSPLPPRDAAWYVQTIAGAIQFAHQHGVLHRDLKPSNILLSDEDRVTIRSDEWRATGGQKEMAKSSRSPAARHPSRATLRSSLVTAHPSLVPKVTDFGLAKRLEGGSQFTASGTMVGTPSYMPPEQARAKAGAVGPASDVYALGAILYELLTARPPFQAATPLDTILQVLDAEPVAPHLLNRKVDRDLETICLKCLQKNPKTRYSTAQELADDLGRYLAGEPILARPVGPAERLVRWCRRNPVVAGLLTFVALLLVGVAVFGFVTAKTERGLRSEAEEAKQIAQKKAEESNYRLVRQYVASAVRVMDEGDLLGSLPLLVEALKLDAQDPKRAELHRFRIASVLSQAPKPTQVWFHDGPVFCARFSPDGARVITASGDGSARIWLTESGLPVGDAMRHAAAVRWAAFSPDGARVITASNDGTARLWNAQTGEPFGAILRHEAAVTHAVFSSDGRHVATASQDKTARVWNSETGEPVTEPLEHSYGVNYVAFNPDPAAPEVLATACGEHSASFFIAGQGRLWDVVTGKLQHVLTHDANVTSVVFSPDGSSVVTTGEEHVAKVWDSVTGQLKISGLRHEDLLTHAAFSPDGRKLVTTSDDDSAKIWDARTGEILAPTLKHAGEVRWVSFSPDGRRLATAGYYGTAQIWDSRTGEAVVPRLQHAASVGHVEFSPDGRRIVTASQDGTARLWDLAAGEPLFLSLAQDKRLRTVAFSPDGGRIVTGGDDGTARVWDSETGKALLAPLQHRARVQYASFSPNGRWVATASDDMSAKVWDMATGSGVGPPLEHVKEVMRVSFSPDSEKIVTASRDHTARVWDVSSGKPLTPPLQHAGTVASASFSPDGARIVTASQDGTARVWNAANGQAITPPIKLGCPGRYAEFSSDGTRIVTAAAEELQAIGDARVWNASSGEPITPPLKHRHAAAHASWSPNSSWIVTASFDDTARVWNATTGEPLTPPMNHKADVWWAWFSRDGSRIVTASGDDTARIWDAATGEPLTPPFRHAIWCTHALFSPNGRRIVTTSVDPIARVWDLPFDDRPLQDLAVLAEVLSGHRLRGAGEFIKLEPDEFKATWLANSPQFAADFSSSPEQARAWHRREATECAITGDWFAQAWQLSKRIELEGANASLMEQRAQCYAELGRWTFAAADFDQAQEWGLRDPEGQYRRALLCLGREDNEGYRKICEQLTAKLGQLSDANAINSAIWTCLLFPDALPDMTPLVRAGEQLLASGQRSSAMLNTLGITYYRAGEYDAAIEHLEAAVKAERGEGTPWDWLFLAMAHHRLGHGDDARKWHEQAIGWIDRETNEKTQRTAGVRLGWEQRLELELLRHEAEGTLVASEKTNLR